MPSPNHGVQVQRAPFTREFFFGELHRATSREMLNPSWLSCALNIISMFLSSREDPGI